MQQIAAALAAVALAAAPVQPAKPQPAPAPTPAPARPHYNLTGAPLPRYWMPCPCHVHPHPPWLWQKTVWDKNEAATRARQAYMAAEAADPGGDHKALYLEEMRAADALVIATDFVAPSDEPPAPPNTMPRRELTPGLTVDISQQEVCSKKWGHDERHVTEEMKREVFESYQFSGNTDPKCIPDAHGARCEIDHLISRELGGADDTRNLWPQPYGGPWNAHDKDRLENRLRKEVCSGKINLLQAQTLIRSDWQQAYRHYFGEPAQ